MAVTVRDNITSRAAITLPASFSELMMVNYQYMPRVNTVVCFQRSCCWDHYVMPSRLNIYDAYL